MTKRYWWVNQNQTFTQETQGGYMWSPKRNKPSQGRSVGSRNPFYENMREVSPGDLVFSFRDTRIPAIGIVRSYGFDSQRPTEFGKAGEQWADAGWRVNVEYNFLENSIRPKDHIEQLRSLLPPKYSPLKSDGNGNQNLYLTELPGPLGELLLQIIGEETDSIVRAAEVATHQDGEAAEETEIKAFEDAAQASIEGDPDIGSTTKQVLVDSRRGQGTFKKGVATIESKCRITGVENVAHLIASHIKPWRSSNNMERMDKNNGLMLTPSIDHLFDRGFISFKDDGELLISPVADHDSLRRMGIESNRTVNVGEFSIAQQSYLQYHREEIFKKASHTD